MFGQSLSWQKQPTKLKLCDKNENSNTNPITRKSCFRTLLKQWSNSHVTYVKKKLRKGISSLL